MSAENDNIATVCFDINDDWYVKIIDNYGNTDFLLIRENISDFEEIEVISEIFNKIILPNHRIDQYGNEIIYDIEDRENLYTINDLPVELWNKTVNPACFESESISEPEYDFSRDFEQRKYSYFDTITQNF